MIETFISQGKKMELKEVQSVTDKYGTMYAFNFKATVKCHF